MPRTRLAPSPTGALHLGNVRTFLVNWALARQQGWEIVLRIEDLDGPRVKAEAVDEAIDILRWLGLDWDIGPLYQRRDLAPYEAALARLAAQGDIYPCRCTRREIEAASLSAPHGEEHELRYPGTCRPPSLEGRGQGRDSQSAPRASQQPGDSFTMSEIPPLAPPFEGGGSRAWRIIVPNGVTAFDDHFAGRHEHDIQATTGDFLVATKEGLPSYQLAVVVDDARQGIDRVVRGDDLLGSTHRQRLLYERLGLGQPPESWHLPLVIGSDGRRLAKRHGDSRVSHYRRHGVTAGQIIGLMAHWCGMGEQRPMTAREFAQRFRLDDLPRSRVLFSPTEEAWLLSQ